MNFRLPDWLPVKSCQSLCLELLSQNYFGFALLAGHRPRMAVSRGSQSPHCTERCKGSFFRTNRVWGRRVGSSRSTGLESLHLALGNVRRTGFGSRKLRTPRSTFRLAASLRRHRYRLGDCEVRSASDSSDNVLETLENVHRLHCSVISCGGGGWAGQIGTVDGATCFIAATSRRIRLKAPKQVAFGGNLQFRQRKSPQRSILRASVCFTSTKSAATCEQRVTLPAG
jgi:hypothetical protein